MEDIVQAMRNVITVNVIQGDAFRVAFISSDPVLAMRVTERLGQLFIDESLRDREVLAEGTNQFLDAQVEDVGTRLAEREKRLEDYRRQYSGELPEQQESNLQAIQNLQMQIQAVLESIRRDQDRRLLLEGQLTELEAPGAVASTELYIAGEVVSGSTTAEQLAAARRALTSLAARNTPAHPDVAAMRRAVVDLVKRVEDEALATPLSGDASGVQSGQQLALQRQINAVRTELEQLGYDIDAKQEEEQRLRADSSLYQARVEMAPTRESEMIELMRDYTTLNSLYSSLLSKREDAQISANLERRQIGEQFRLLDPARIPERPFSPNRPRMTFMGMAAGLGLGVGLVCLLEYRDKTLKTDDEVRELFGLPVLAVVPVMKSVAERRLTTGRHTLTTVMLGGCVLACLGVVAYTFVR